MELWKKIIVGACDFMVKETGSQMRSMERDIKEKGGTPNDDFYRMKDNYNRTKNQYEANKKNKGY